MKYCEWQEVYCPFAGKVDKCQIESRARFLKLESQQIPEGNDEYWAVEDQLSDIAQVRCPLEEALHPTLEMCDFTNQQLALVGARRKDPPFVGPTAGQVEYQSKRQQRRIQLEEQITELKTKDTDLTNVARAEILGISLTTFNRILKSLRRSGRLP